MGAGEGPGYTVWTVYESCGFGYTLHYQLVAAGARSMVISPIRLDKQHETGFNYRAA